MEPIQDTLSEMMKKSQFQTTFSKIKDEIVTNRDIQKFLQKISATDEMIDRSLAKLYEFHRQHSNCLNCRGLDQCMNVMPGYSPELVVVHGAVDVMYERCPLKEKDDEEQKQRQLFESMYIPKEMLNVRFSDLDVDPQRIEAIDAAEKYVNEFEPGKTKHGLYFYGDFGVGKTFITCAIANELALSKKVKSMIVYTPDFFRELKHSIGQDTFHEKLNYIKTVPLLILDDIGSETISTWIRDDVLGAILQYRMMEGLPTLYTSNYDYDGLEDHLAYSEKSGTELIKAKRIMERIRHYTIPQYIGGANRRENFIQK